MIPIAKTAGASHRLASSLATMAAAVLTCAMPAQAEPETVDLPVTRAVLFSSGVGYFEHVGTVHGDAVVRLQFNKDQINDVLKSMVLMDLDGGTVSTVTYPSQDPVERALASFAIDISDNPSMDELLRAMRGATITIHAPERITGTILSVQPHAVPAGASGKFIMDEALNLVTNEGIRTIPMNAIHRLELDDPKLRDELNRALALLAGSLDTERRPVEIRFDGRGERRVRIGYLVEAPVWKTSYRLDLSEDKPLLQGWAIVENASDHDWRRVNLRLVSGRPISFIQDLYTPLYVPRPVVQPQLYAAVTPRQYESASRMDQREMYRAAAAPDPDRMAERQRAPQRRGVGGGWGAEDMDAIYEAEMALGASIMAVGDGASVGELFEFVIRHPVNMQRRQSAMLPIINQGVAAERVSIYNSSTLERHPLNGVWITNDTGLSLLGGPVTVFDGGAYAGDAQIGHLGPGDKRLLSYAVDLAVLVDSSQRQQQHLTEVKIERGVMQVSRRRTFERTYKIDNKSDRDRTLIVEHQINRGATLVEPEKPEEQTPQLYRFRIEVDGESAGDFIVREQQPVSETIRILDQSDDTLAWYINAREVSGEVRAALRRAIELRHALSELQTQRNSVQSALNSLKQGQQRLRENLAAVGHDSPLGRRYLARLAEEEDQIEEMEKQIAGLNEQVERARRELQDYVAGLNVQ